MKIRYQVGLTLSRNDSVFPAFPLDSLKMIITLINCMEKSPP